MPTHMQAIGGLIVLTVVSIALTLWVSDLGNVLAGITAGAIILLAQNITSYLRDNETRQLIDRVKELGVKDILPTRDDEAYYGEIIDRAEEEVWVCGVTASRFARDFMDVDSPRRTKRRLVDYSLRNSIRIRLLVADTEHLTGEDLHKAHIAHVAFKKIRQELNDELFQVRTYSHKPTHSIVRVDEEYVLGPSLKTRTSGNTPAIHLVGDSEYVEAYREYLEDEWDSATPVSF